MKEPELKEFLKNRSKGILIKLFSEGSMDDLVYLIDLAPQPDDLLESLPLKQKTTLKKFMAYPQDSAGRIMQDDFFSLPLESFVEEGIEKLREYSREKFVHYIYSTDKNQILLGVLSIRQLAISSSTTKIKDIIIKI